MSKNAFQKKLDAAKEKGERKNIGVAVRTAVLTESGYRCAVPTCRSILALDLHHMWQVSEGGGDVPENLIALCPNDHALYHRGTTSSESIYAYKAMLVALNAAFDKRTVDLLLLLAKREDDFIVVSGDGVLEFAHLIGSGLADVQMVANNNWQLVNYTVAISEKGRLLVTAWKNGKRNELAAALSGVSSGHGEPSGD